MRMLQMGRLFELVANLSCLHGLLIAKPSWGSPVSIIKLLDESPILVAKGVWVSRPWLAQIQAFFFQYEEPVTQYMSVVLLSVASPSHDRLAIKNGTSCWSIRIEVCAV
jgi:hypothetical protein